MSLVATFAHRCRLSASAAYDPSGDDKHPDAHRTIIRQTNRLRRRDRKARSGLRRMDCPHPRVRGAHMRQWAWSNSGATHQPRSSHRRDPKTKPSRLPDFLFNLIVRSREAPFTDAALRRTLQPGGGLVCTRSGQFLGLIKDS